jgi:hypothetical protein
MASVTADVTLGIGKLYLNNVDVGHIKGDVVLSLKQTEKDFKPSNCISPVTTFVIGEEISLKASLAELSLAHIKLALGVTTSVITNSSFPAYDPSSYAPATGASFDVLTLGGSRTVDKFSLRYEGSYPDGRALVIVLYSVSSNKDFALNFKEEDITMMDLTFKAWADTNRAEGDMVGIMCEQTAASV